MTIYSRDVLLSIFGTSPLFHVLSSLLLLDLHTDFSGSRLGGLVFPSLEEFPTVCWLTQSKALVRVNEAEVDVFLEFSCFYYDPMDVGKLISGSSTFSKSSLNIWKFSVHILLKPNLENFKHYFASMWDEYNCVVVWAFFDIAFLWDWNENWPFLTKLSLVATAEFSKFVGILSAAFSQYHLLGFEIAQLEFHHLY